MSRFFRIFRLARRLFWFLDLVMDPSRAARALLDHSQVKRWLEDQTLEDQEKIRAAAPLVVGAIVASLD